jgi:hypothetical protein
VPSASKMAAMMTSPCLCPGGSEGRHPLAPDSGGMQFLQRPRGELRFAAPRNRRGRGRRNLKPRAADPYTYSGGERGPVTFPVFKAGDSVLRGSNGGFDSHTLPPTSLFFAGYRKLLFHYCSS